MTDKKLISSLQGLRAVAFLCVVISHCGAPWPAFRYNVLFTPSAVLLVWLLAMGKGFISRLLSAKPFLWLAQLSPYGFLIHQVLIRYMEWTADKFSLTVQPVVWTLTVFLLTLCLSWFYKALERRVRQRHAKVAAQ